MYYNFVWYYVLPEAYTCSQSTLCRVLFLFYILKFEKVQCELLSPLCIHLAGIPNFATPQSEHLKLWSHLHIRVFASDVHVFEFNMCTTCSLTLKVKVMESFLESFPISTSNPLFKKKCTCNHSQTVSELWPRAVSSCRVAHSVVYNL